MSEDQGFVPKEFNDANIRVAREFKARAETAEARLVAAMAEIERLRLNHKDAVETKRRTDVRLKWALAGLQRIYNESSDSRMAEIAGEAFEKATSPIPPSQSETP